MSHSKERQEKKCLNCNADLFGRFCHVCGQENIEPKETVWGLISHFFYDITHFDGKFFSTCRYLITRPGFLPKEYLEGRRARYLHPIRMYVFTSAVFFLIFFSLVSVKNWSSDKEDDAKEAKKNESKRYDSAIIKMDTARVHSLARAQSKADSATVEQAFEEARHSLVVPKDTTSSKKKKEKKKKPVNINLGEKSYTSVREYDSAQRALPADERDGWFERTMERRGIELHNRYGDNEDTLEEELMERFFHTFPYLLFVSLPLYALYLKILYWRRKQFLFVSHALFLIYLYIFTFIDLLLMVGVQKLKDALGWSWLYGLEAILALYGVYYTYKAMGKFYGQGRGKTFLKFIILNIWALFTLIFLFVVFFSVIFLKF